MQAGCMQQQQLLVLLLVLPMAQEREAQTPPEASPLWFVYFRVFRFHSPPR